MLLVPYFHLTKNNVKRWRISITGLDRLLHMLQFHNSNRPGHRLFHVFLEDGRYHALPATGALAGMQVKPSEAWNQKAWETVVCSCLNSVPVVMFVFLFGASGKFQMHFLISNGLACCCIDFSEVSYGVLT